jgi:predicted site-specific integrase-resolvase
MNPRRRLINGREAAALCAVRPATVRDWVRRGELRSVATDNRDGSALYLEAHVLIAERNIRRRRRKRAA